MVRREQIEELPKLLASVDLAAKQRALRKVSGQAEPKPQAQLSRSLRVSTLSPQVWTRLVWRGALREPLRSQLGAPDAFETAIEALRVRLRKLGSM